MSSIQEMIEMQKRLAEMVRPVTETWNTPSMDYLRQNASAIYQTSQVAQQMAASLESVVGSCALNDSFLGEREQIVSQMSAGLGIFRTPGYIDTIQSVVNGLGNMTDMLSTFAGIINNFKIPQEIIRESLNVKFVNYAKDISESIIGNSEAVDVLKQNSNLIKGAANLYEGVFDNIDLAENNLTELTNSIYEEMVSDSDEEVAIQSEEGFRNDAEIREAFLEQANNPVGMQERFANWSEKKKKQFYILFLILSFIWSNFIQDDFKQYVCQPIKEYVVTKIRELPNKKAGVVGELKNEQAVITGDEPYYYKIIFTGEDGKTHEGYVSKRSVILIENVDKELDRE